MSMPERFRLVWLIAFFLVAGCAAHHNVPAVDVGISPPVMERIPLRVVVVVPDPNHVMTKTGNGTETVPAGRLIGNLSQQVFPHVFQDVQFMSSRAYPAGIDAAVIPAIQDFRFIPEQVALGFGMRFIAEVSLKGVLTDQKGKPLWEHVATASKTSRSVVSPAIPFEQLMGESFSEALAEAFKQLAQEMTRSREIRAYAAAKGGPAASPRVRRAAAPAPANPAPPAAPAKPAPPPAISAVSGAAPEMGKLPPLRKEAHAIVIGIDYTGRQDIPNLQYAARDAQKVYDLLTDPRYGGVPKGNAVLLLNDQATRNRIMASLRRMKGWNGYVYLYYSGHGAPKTVGEKLTDGYLVPADAMVADPETLEDTSIKISFLQDLIESSSAQGVMVALDACFSGGGKSIVPKGGRPLVGMLVTPEMMAPKAAGRMILTSSAMNQQSWEDEAEIKGGIFTHYFLEGLKGKAGGDAWVRADAIADYVARNVPQAARRLKGQEQVPQIRGKADFAVVRNWEKTKVEDLDIVRGALRAAFEKGRIDAGQLGRALDELRTQKRSKTLEAFLGGMIDEKTFGELY
jgi:hypothetical protein